MKFIRSPLVINRTAATEILQKDLPVNPLSHLIISLEMYNATDEATLAEILAFINKIEVTHMGKTIVSLESEDLAAENAYLYKANPILTQNDAADNTTRLLSLIVPFGRSIFNPDECYPATKKGELQLNLDYTAPNTAADNGILNIETVEILGANPTKYLKSTMLTVTAPGATGDHDVDLPIGNDIIALQLRMTTFPATSSHTYGVNRARVLVDNSEEGYADASAQGLVGDGIFHLSTLPRDIAAFGDIIPANVVWLDYDPLRDNNYLLQTEGKSSVKARLNMGVDEATYLTIMELVRV